MVQLDSRVFLDYIYRASRIYTFFMNSGSGSLGSRLGLTPAVKLGTFTIGSTKL